MPFTRQRNDGTHETFRTPATGHLGLIAAPSGTPRPATGTPNGPSASGPTRKRKFSLKRSAASLIRRERPPALTLPRTGNASTLAFSMAALSALAASQAGARPARNAGERPTGVWGWTSGSQTYIRVRPGALTPPVAKVDKHTKVFVWGKFDGWYRVETPDHHFGWIYNSYVSSPDTHKVQELSHRKAELASDRTAHQKLYGSPVMLHQYYAKYGAKSAGRDSQQHSVRMAANTHPAVNRPQLKQAPAPRLAARPAPAKPVAAVKAVAPRKAVVSNPRLAARPQNATPKAHAAKAARVNRPALYAMAPAAPLHAVSFDRVSSSDMSDVRRDLDGVRRDIGNRRNPLLRSPSARPDFVGQDQAAPSRLSTPLEATPKATPAATPATTATTATATTATATTPAATATPTVTATPHPTPAAQMPPVPAPLPANQTPLPVFVYHPKPVATPAATVPPVMPAPQPHVEVQPAPHVTAPVSSAPRLVHKPAKPRVAAKPKTAPRTAKAAPRHLSRWELAKLQRQERRAKYRQVLRKQLGSPAMMVPPTLAAGVAPVSPTELLKAREAYLRKHHPGVAAVPAPDRPSSTTSDGSAFSAPPATVTPSAGVPNSLGGPAAPVAPRLAMRGGSPRDYLAYGQNAIKSGDKAAAATFGDTMSRQALSYRGSPYIRGAESPDQGFDCSGLIYYLLRQRGYNPPRTAAGYASYGQSVSQGQLQPGDLVLFANTYKRGISHIGVYTGNGKFVHAARPGEGVRVDSLNDSYYARHYWGARRIK